MPSSWSLRYGFIVIGAFGQTHLHVAGTQKFKQCSNPQNREEFKGS